MTFNYSFYDSQLFDQHIVFRNSCLNFFRIKYIFITCKRLNNSQRFTIKIYLVIAFAITVYTKCRYPILNNERKISLGFHSEPVIIVHDVPFLEDADITRAYDPRLTVLDGLVYMCFAVDTRHGVRGGIARTDDFSKFEILSLTPAPPPR